ncbi:DUF6543 domain-containing protein [Pseudomonas trivialis]|uniref:dermonecrotic toxin domain-containing protein n=1 Tax=Pseudomonas trivialis TaxID=200450 RepID=UPI0030D4A057
MSYESLTASPLMQRLSAKDSASQISLALTLSSLGSRAVELLVPQPGFEDFVQHRFDQHFSTLTPRLEVRKGYVQSREVLPTTPLLSQAPDTAPLLATVLDAVIERIVTGKTSTCARHNTLFLRATAENTDPQPVPELTAQAFDEFVDSLATGLVPRYKAFMQAYWDHTAEGAVDAGSRRERLVGILIEQLRTEMLLLRSDNLISIAGEILLNKVMRYPGALERQTIEGYRPCVYRLAMNGAESDPLLYGAFVLTGRDPQDGEVVSETDTPVVPQVRPVNAGMNLGIVLLFIPGSGLEEFDSLASLDRELHRRLNHPEAFTSLLALMAQKDQPHGLDLHRAGKSSEQIKYLEWLDSPFSQSVEAQYLRHQEDFISTLARYRALTAQVDRGWLPQNLDQVTDLTSAFDSSGVLYARFKKRGQARLKIFLEQASNADKLAWQAAMRDYCDELLNPTEEEGLPSFAQFSDKTVLLAYSKAQLSALLEAQFGLQADPDDIVIHTKEPNVEQVPYVPGAHGSIIRDPGTPTWRHRQRSLTELGLENVGGLDVNFTNFSRLTDKKGVAYTALTVEQVKTLVRSANVGNSYDTLLRDRLITSPEALARKTHYARCLARQMRLDAIEAKIAGDFLPDQAQRGFNWVRVVLDQPEDNDRRETVEGHRIVVKSLMLRGERVRGVLLICSASSTSALSNVIYAPQAPGGRVFYEFSGDQLFRTFIYDSSWRDYLVGRVRRTEQRRIRTLLRATISQAAVHFPRIDKNIFDEAYEIAASTVINDADAQSTTTGETDLETVTTAVTAALDVLTLVLPVYITFPLGLARSLISVLSAIEAAAVGDREETANHIVRALGEFVGALVDGALGFSKPSLRVPHVPRGLNPQMALKITPDNLSPVQGWSDKGIFYRPSTAQSPRQYFLKERGRWFSLVDEGGEQAWRIKDARKPHRYHHDPIRLDKNGRWEVGSHPGTGLRGGLSPREGLQQLYPYLSEHQVRRVFESFAFPSGHETEFQLSLVHYLRSNASLDGFHQYLLVSPEQLMARLRGAELLTDLLGASIEPTPGPSQGSSSRSPVARFLDWGQTIDPVEIQLRDSTLSGYRRIGGDPALRGTDYIRIDEQYFPVLPAGGATFPEITFMHKPNQRLRTFEAFEEMLRVDRFDQPRKVIFASRDGRWVNNTTLPFPKTLSASVAESFPMLTAASQVDVARTLFYATNPDRLTTYGMIAMQHTLLGWRSSSSVAPLWYFGEPFSLLRRTRPAHGVWWMDRPPARNTQLMFRNDRVPTLLNRAAVDDGALKRLMTRVLTDDGYEIVSAYNVPGELLFKRPARERLYWLQIRRGAMHSTRTIRTQPQDTLMNTHTRTQVADAQASNRFVSLLGGVASPPFGGPPDIFIIRI